MNPQNKGNIPLETPDSPFGTPSSQNPDIQAAEAPVAPQPESYEPSLSESEATDLETINALNSEESAVYSPSNEPETTPLNPVQSNPQDDIAPPSESALNPYSTTSNPEDIQPARESEPFNPVETSAPSPVQSQPPVQFSSDQKKPSVLLKVVGSVVFVAAAIATGYIFWQVMQ